MSILRDLSLVLAVVAIVATAATAAGQEADTDLSVSDVALSPETPEPGDNVTIEATIRHESGQQTDYEVDFTVNESVLQTRTGNSTDFLVDDTHTVTAPDVWTNVPIGTHDVRVDVTADGNDTNTSNDVRTFSVGIGPDLVVSNVSTDAEDPAEGDQVTLSATVENRGNQDAGEFGVEFVVDGSAVGTPTVDGLAVEDSTTVEATWTAEAGTQTITVEADASDAVEEANEDNNTRDGPTLDVEPTFPDLVISNIITQPLTPDPGDEVNIQATVRNAGDAAASPSKAMLTIDGSTITPNANVDELDPGQQAAALWTWDASIGVHELEAKVDVGDTVDESDEENNDANRSLTVGPDLAVDDLRVTPSSPAAGQPITIEATVSNGGAAIDSGVDLSAAVDGSPVAARTLDGFDAGTIREISLGPFNATAGEHQVSVTADPDDAVEEALETNNDRSISVTVAQGLPDLTVVRAELVRSTVAPGEEIQFSATVSNAGQNASGAFDVRFLVDGEEVGQPSSLPGLGAGERSSVTSGNWTAEGGAHSLRVVVDPGSDDGSVDESDESNNAIRLDFAIGPDLTPVDLALDPAEPKLGQRATVTARIVNAGTQGADAFDVRVRVGDEDVLSETVDGLGPLEETTLDAEWTARDADTARVEVDVGDDVDEVSESNNTLAVDLSVDDAVPDLVARNLSADPDGPQPGDNVTFALVVANEGAADSSRFLVRFETNGTTLHESVVDGLAAGDEVTVDSTNWTAPAGDTNVTAHVDPDDEVPEPNEDNNRARLVVTVEEDALGIPTPGVLAVLVTLTGAVALRRR